MKSLEFQKPLNTSSETQILQPRILCYKAEHTKFNPRADLEKLDKLHKCSNFREILILIFFTLKISFANLMINCSLPLFLRIAIYFSGAQASKENLSALALSRSISNLVFESTTYGINLKILKEIPIILYKKEYKEIGSLMKTIYITFTSYFICFTLTLLFFVEDLMNLIGFPPNFSHKTLLVSRWLFPIMFLCRCATAYFNMIQNLGDYTNLFLVNFIVLSTTIPSFFFFLTTFNQATTAFVSGLIIFTVLILLALLYCFFQVLGPDSRDLSGNIKEKFWERFFSIVKNTGVGIVHFLELELIICLAGYTGDEVVISAMSIVTSYYNFAGIASFCISKTCLINLTRFYGSGNQEERLNQRKAFFKLNFLLGIFLGALVNFFAPQIARASTIHDDVSSLLEMGIRILSVGFICFPNHHYSIGVFSLEKKLKKYYLVALFSNYVLGIGIGVVLFFVFDMKFYGLVSALAIGIIARVLMGIVLLGDK